MKHFSSQLRWASLLAISASMLAPTAAGAGFRIRSDFAADLNADQGWAAAPNESATISADAPFRVRFEWEGSGERTAAGRLGLQYRRNGGEWVAVEAHDFPKPEAELSLGFEPEAAGKPPPGWRFEPDSAAEFTIAPDGARGILRARAAEQPMLAHYPPPWDLTGQLSLATRVRMPAGASGGAGLAFGDFGRRDYLRITMDPSAGAVRVSRMRGDSETLLAEHPAPVTAGRWHELEAQYEGDQLEVTLDDDVVEFTTVVSTGLPRENVGLIVPAGSAAEFQRFGIEGEPRTPRLSAVSCPAFANGAATSDVLRESTTPFHAGAGISLAARTPAASGPAGAHTEFEWALVVRRYADGAVTNEEGDVFELRMTDEAGAPVTTRHARLRLTIPPGHLGGTFVETPGRIGPWRAGNGDLYFVMEPAETDNLFMMVKSTDGGRTWREVDGANRPRTGDLEAVEGRHVGDTIHLIHQVTRSSRYHTFRTSDHPTHPDTWDIRDERAASAVSVAQSATLVVRSDGSLVTFHTGSTIHYAVRSPAGQWGAETVLDEGQPPNLAGPRAELGANDHIHLAYYGMDGTVWYRRLLPDGTLTPRQQLAAGVGATRAEFGAVLPLVYLPRTDTCVVLYQQVDGRIWERRIVGDAPPSDPVLVAPQPVVRDAVDSQQPGADAVVAGDTVRVLFIDAATRSLFSTHDRGGWQPPQREVSGIRGSWVRGSIFPRPDGSRVYGYVYDAGSKGGAGFNRFGELVLPD